ncbi:hypothetical protein A11A3_01907 [Alcanivorax hongdengensis A-11-3]|uniref:PA2779 family protein n=1 Tax=Alcanivorax hongdengensis A-11-3 TaxID=1177179 RepID=L0WEX9_9GAMM|nr:PA2779 family protein [Alcanivorax hongdengensis]EKF75586.1 hypothetical protein A11A3_01907 [Alcanivorax hongdengensis A-11-3]
MKKSLTALLTTAALMLSQLIMVPAAQAAMIQNDTVLAQQQRADMEARVMRLMDQKAAASVLSDYGVSKDQVQSRLSHLSDQELQQLADKADDLPAGQGVVGVILAVILILVLLDLLGATNVFPAIHSLGSQ